MLLPKWKTAAAFSFVFFAMTYCLAADENIESYKFPPCQACRLFINSFNEQLKKIQQGKVETGNKDEKPFNFERREDQLNYIKRSLCSDVVKGKEQCTAIAEETKKLVEEWWSGDSGVNTDLHEFLCINTMQHCCPEDHFGKDCDPCPGYPGNVCSLNGKCKGAGTRKGNGKCECKPGYVGEMCDDCDSSFYKAYHKGSNILCSRCHRFCEGDCTEGGPKGCVKCKSGFSKDEKFGCVDINECLVKRKVCKKSEFCVNNEGSYACIQCDESCETCDGDGPDMCRTCAANYMRKDGMCVNREKIDKEWYVTCTRYLTYFGMCIATCIIFNKNPAIAAVIGLCVGMYIAVSEYMLAPADSGQSIFNNTYNT